MGAHYLSMNDRENQSPAENLSMFASQKIIWSTTMSKKLRLLEIWCQSDNESKKDLRS